MRILVCVKQVPDSQSSFRINDEATGIKENGIVFVLNDYDRYAMEEAIRIREALGDVEITVVSVGPGRVESSIRKALELGGQDGLHIDDSDAPAVDALSVASLIAAWAKDKYFDLVLCGVMSEDFQRGQVGPMLAELLGFSCATTVVSEQISEGRDKVLVERELERGLREQVELALPAVLTIQSGINVPRYGSLSNVLRVKKMEIPSVAALELGPVDSCEELVRVSIPETRATCEFITGSLDEMADRLIYEVLSKAGVLG